MATSIFRRALSILREEGIISLIISIGKFFYWNLGIRTIYRKGLLLAVGSSSSAAINGTKLKFRTKTFTEYERVRDLMGEKEVITDFLEELKEDDVVYDVGANIGIYACFAASDAPERRIEAFEPHPNNAKAIEKNAELNNLSISTHQIALSDNQGEMLLNEEGSEAGVGKHSLATNKSADSITVEVDSIDHLVDTGRAPQPTVVKIDVEGAEYHVLNGGADNLYANCRLLYCELHPHKLDKFSGDVDDILSYIENLGFETEIIRDDENYSTKTIKGKKAQ